MNFLKKNQNKMRFCSLLIWKRLFLKKEILSEILMDEMYFISLNEKDKSFVYYIINVVLRNSVQIEFFYKRFLKKKINDDLVDLKGILSLGTAEIFWSRTPNYAIVDSYVDLTKDKFGKKKAGFVNAILLNLIRNKEKISSLNWNVRNNFPRALLKNWEIYYGKKLTNDIVNTISSNPYLDLICSKKMPKTYKKKLIQYLEGKEIYPNVIRSIYKGRISNIQGFLEGNWWIQDIGSYIHLEILINKLIRDKNFNIQKPGDRGLVQLFSILPTSYPGHSIITEDIGEILPENKIKCSIDTTHFLIHGRSKHSEIRGCSDV